MALGDPYANIAELEVRLNKTDDGSFAALLDTASRAVEAFTGRQFNRSETASARRFRALDTERLPVDDFYTSTDLAVTVDGITWDLANIDPRPWDGIVNGQSGWPFFDLFAINRTWPWWQRRPTITVTARWGWAAVPEGVKQATLDGAELMANAAVGKVGPVNFEAIEGYSVRYQSTEFGVSKGDIVPPGMGSVTMYRRRRFGVA